MKLGEHFLTGGRSRSAPTRSVSFRACGTAPGGVEKMIAEVSACLAFVNEGARAEAIRDANDYLLKFYRGQPIPAQAREDEETYHILNLALRDAGDPRQPLCANGVDELRQALVLHVARELWVAFTAFMAEEFPSQVSAETFGELVEDAKKKSLPDLLSGYGFSTILRSLPSLAAALGTSPTQT